jgi:hypothetical protein
MRLYMFEHRSLCFQVRMTVTSKTMMERAGRIHPTPPLLRHRIVGMTNSANHSPLTN